MAAFAAHFRDKKPAATVDERKSLPLDERLALAIIEGIKEGLADDLDEAMQARLPLEIINGPLMAGMDEVGRQFNANELIVAEVLQSAEAMKFAVAHLEPHMDKLESATRGKVVLATVKGDVHDIGKNLVDIIVGNNGYKVINLGIKVPPEKLIEACREHKPDIIGLSGLLVKSAQMMVDTVRDFRQAGVNSPILVGGAALSNRFTRLRIAPEYGGLVAYASDAMTGLALANTIMEADEREKMAATLESETREMKDAEARRQESSDQEAVAVAPAQVAQDHQVPNPPDLRLHVLRDHDMEKIFSYINPQMLYVRHLGFKGRFAEALEAEEAAALELRESVRRVEDVMLARPDIQANGVFKFFPAQSDGQWLLIYEPDGKSVLERFYFGRQFQREGLCLADYILPQSSGRMDYVALFATTMGPGVRELAEQWKDEGEYLNSHILQALALEGAEGFAEVLHQQIRQMWGFGDPAGISYQDLFRTQYRGRRYSFGYPACPRLEDQEQLFRLLDVTDNIGVELTEGYMMDPESSVSALVVHHPGAKYFTLDERDITRLEGEIASQTPR